MARKIIFAFTAGVLALSASACNTVKGVGQDIESVGDAGDRAI
ncbi:MAG: entericidin A/B family lipoprotein [Erythrobacter sp.]|nr:MAG: entericidin A/B family lipoprotein [Erythrobacter sp.]